MGTIKLVADNIVIAELVNGNEDSPPTWVIHDPLPRPGPGSILVGDVPCPIEIVCPVNGWLIIRIAFDYIAAVAWHGKKYYAELLVDGAGRPTKRYGSDLYVRGLNARIT